MRGSGGAKKQHVALVFTHRLLIFDQMANRHTHTLGLILDLIPQLCSLGINFVVGFTKLLSGLDD